MTERKVLVFGATGALGEAMVDEFSQSAPTTIFSPSRSDLDLAKASIHDCVSFIQSIGIPDGLDALVYSAGINFPKPFTEISEDDLMKTIHVNSLSFFKVMQAASPILKSDDGRVVAISSIYGSISRTGRAAYSMSKAALEGVVRSLAVEFAAENILVNAVSPGFVQTRLTEQNNTKTQIAELVSQVPLGRLASCAEVAKLVDFLIDKDRNTYLTGQNIIIDGGFSIV